VFSVHGPCRSFIRGKKVPNKPRLLYSWILKKTFDKTWYLGLLYKLSELKFSTNLIKLINSFLSQIKFRVSVEGELSSPRDIQVGVPQGSVLSPTLSNLFINDMPQTPGVSLGLFADDTCIYATDRKEGYVSESCSEVSSAIELWCERWNIKINEDKTQAIYFSHRLRPPETHLTLNGRNIPFVNHVKYLGVIFDM
jgi:hypothetical protein